MWLWPLMGILLSNWGGTAFAAPTSSGPTSTEELEVLLREGKNALTTEHYQDAVNSFQRVLDRYPGLPGYAESRLYLGKAYLGLGQTKKALVYLNDYVSTSGLNSFSADARNALGKGYLIEHQFHEAYLSTIEVDQMAKKIKLDSDLILQSLLIKAEALLGLRHEARAISAIEAAEKQLSDQNSSELKGQTYSLKLQLNIFHCDRFPGPGPITEGQLRDQLQRRGTCLLETLPLFRKILNTGAIIITQSATRRMNQAYSDYYHACKSPKIDPRGIAPIQKKRFIAELAERLILDFNKNVDSTQELLHSWKSEKTDSSTDSSRDSQIKTEQNRNSRLTEVSEHLQTLSKNTVFKD